MVVAVERRPIADALLRMLPALISRTSHDLNNHLALILGKAELALLISDAEKYRSSLEEVYDAGQAARLLVADLQRIVAWSTTEDDVLTVTDVLSLVGRMCARHGRQAGVHLAVEPDSAILPAGDGAALSVLLWHLVSEALAATEARGADEESWTLAGSRSDAPGVSLETTRPIWDVETRAAASRAMRTGESLPGAVGELVAHLRSLGASLTFDGAAVRLTM